MRDGAAYRTIVNPVTCTRRDGHPTSTAIKMALRPLDLPPLATTVMQPVAKAMQYWLMR